MSETWEVRWTDPAGGSGVREFRDFLAAWTFNEEILKGKGEVILVTDRPRASEHRSRSEAEQARRQEGGRRGSRRP